MATWCSRPPFMRMCTCEWAGETERTLPRFSSQLARGGVSGGQPEGREAALAQQTQQRQDVLTVMSMGNTSRKDWFRVVLEGGTWRHTGGRKDEREAHCMQRQSDAGAMW